MSNLASKVTMNEDKLKRKVIASSGLAVITFLASIAVPLTSCSTKHSAEDQSSANENVPIEISRDWKLGCALWAFHTFTLNDALNKIDSTDLKVIEGVTILKPGGEFKDSAIRDLSPRGMDKLNKTFAAHNLTVETVYVMGDNSLQSWIKEFEVSKAMGAKFVTGEPPLHLLDALDSLIGIYDMKFAIHPHWKGVSKYWSPDSLLSAINGRSNFGACIDLGHLPKSGVDPVEAVKKLEGHILVMHLKDIAAANDPELRDVPLGTGIIDFPVVFAELKRQNFKGPMIIERDAQEVPSNLPSIISAIEYYKSETKKFK